jgi:ATP-dependent RNA helicase DOB1
VYTDYRPTPLQIYCFPQNGDGIHLIVDEKSKFREENFQKCLSLVEASKGKTTQEQAKKGNTENGSDIYKLVKMIMERKYQPVFNTLLMK